MNGIYPRVFALVISTEKRFKKMLYAFDLGLDILTCFYPYHFYVHTGIDS